MSWSSKWPSVVDEITIENKTNQPLTIWPSGTVIQPNEKYNNLSPTHDPYVNPNAHIYYECGCGAILDPGTKSFASLNNAAMNTGWKIRWGAHGYVPYCVECGKDVE